MSHRVRVAACAAATVIAVAWLAPVPAASQPRAVAVHASTVPRTPWRQPDLQGVRDFRTITPMQRPVERDKEVQ